MRAKVSAVFILVSDVPILWGRYVTRARTGCMRALCHVEDLRAVGESMSRIHSVAAAVIIGCGVSSVGGVNPPSTEINSGECVRRSIPAAVSSSRRICSL